MIRCTSIVLALLVHIDVLAVGSFNLSVLVDPAYMSSSLGPRQCATVYRPCGGSQLGSPHAWILPYLAVTFPEFLLALRFSLRFHY